MTFVGYQVVGDFRTGLTDPFHITVDLSALTGPNTPIQDGDVAYVMPHTTRAGASPPTPNWGATGWVQVGAWTKWRNNNPSFGGNLGVIFEKELDGTETTVTFTDFDSNFSLFGAVVAVYRGITARGATYEQDSVDDVTTPAGPAILTSTYTLPAISTTSGPDTGETRQIILYVLFNSFGDLSAGGGASVATWDAGINARFTRYYPNGPTIGWGDEEFTAAPPLPGRVTSVASTINLNFQYGRMTRFWFPADLPDGDTWAWGVAGDAWGWL